MALTAATQPGLRHAEPLPPHCQVIDLGLVEYAAAWDLQARLAEEIGQGRRPPTLLLLEHLHTYTFGRKGKAENLLWDATELERRGVAVHWVDRGGDVTYHGPGQLVGYPLIPLAGPVEAGRLPDIDTIAYLRRLEAALIEALRALGVSAHREPGMTGVWLAQPGLAKIGAIGIKVDSRGVTRHGFALNVAPDMTYWQGIIGCGLAGYAVTSLAQVLEAPPAMQQVKEAVVTAFGAQFGFAMQAAPDGSAGIS